MIDWLRSFGRISAIGIALFAPVGALAQTKCPEIPEVPWWFSDHEQIIGEVNQSQGGDWARYTDRWERQRDQMEEIAVTNGRAVVRSHNVTLEGATLRDYINKLDQRIVALKCLAASAPPPPAAAAAPPRTIPRPAQSRRPADEIARLVAACPAPPAVAWWGTVSKQTMAAAVKERFANDWRLYVQRWERELGRLNDAMVKGEPAMMNDLGYELGGPDLVRHIAEVANLILSVKCMADANT